MEVCISSQNILNLFSFFRYYVINLIGEFYKPVNTFSNRSNYDHCIFKRENTNTSTKNQYLSSVSVSIITLIVKRLSCVLHVMCSQADVIVSGNAVGASKNVKVILIFEVR